VLLIAVTLILLKLGFLLLLVVGPFFLLIGTHPGFGRVVAIRWFELLVGVLLKMAAVSLVLSILLYSYTLIMGTSDAALPWALKILMIALVTIAVFIYRRPFQHLFSAVGYGVIGSRERAETDLSRAGESARSRHRDVAAAVPGFAAYRAARWARRNPAAAAAGSAAAARAAAAHGAAGMPDGEGDAAVATRKEFADAGGSPSGGPPDLSHAGRPAASARSRAWAASSGAEPGRAAPPLNLPSRGGAAAAAAAGAAAGAVAGRAHGNGHGNGNGHGSSSGSGGGSVSGSGGGGGSGVPTGWTRGSGAAAAGGAAAGAAAAGRRVPPGPSPAPAPGPAARPVSFSPGAPAGGGGSPPGQRTRSSGSAPQAPRPAPPAAAPPPAPPARRSAPAPRPAPAPRSSPSRAAPGPDPAASGGRGSASAPSRAPSGPARGPAGPVTGAGRTPAGGRDSETGSPPATPFWLRPIRRQK